MPTVGLAEDLDAVVKWHRKVELSTLVTGVVSAVNVAVGDIVEQDSVLLQLDDRVVKADILKQEDNVARLTRLYDEAQRELDRNKELYDRTLLSDHELEIAHINLAEAKASLSAAKAALTKASVDLQYSSVKAPFRGLIVKRNAEVGQSVVSQQTAPILFELAALDKLLAVASVTVDGLRRLKQGKKITVTYAGKSYDGVIQNVGLEPLSPKSNHYPVNIVFESKGARIPIGVTLKVKL